MFDGLHLKKKIILSLINAAKRGSILPPVVNEEEGSSR